MRVNCVIIMVSDMAGSVAFYRDVLGLPLRFETSHWTEFATEGATLALHIADGGPSAARDSGAGQCRPGFSVPDLQAYHAHLLAQGVECVRAPEEVFGAWIAQYRDPDGMLLSVSQTQG